MSRTRMTAAALLVATALAVASPASALPANLKAFALVRGHSYADGNHHVSGKLRLVNTGTKDMRLNCTVTVTWASSSGDTAKRHDKLSDIQVGAGQTRFLHFNVKLRDPSHQFANIPTHVAPHCFLA